MKKVLFILGPTASGKTKLAFELASKLNGELVSVDSVQVYKGLDIISGKDIPKDSKFFGISNKFPNLKNKLTIGYYLVNDIPIYLLDITNPNYSFSVSDYLDIAIPAINYIHSKNKLPIVIGGTGLYVKALLDGIETLNIPSSKVLRKKLEEKTIEELQEILEKEDLKRFKLMNDSDKKNRRRLIRGIEVVRWFKNNKKGSFEIKKLKNVESLLIGLFSDQKIIRDRIDKRVEERIKQGAISEASTLFQNYSNLSNQVKSSNGYKELFEYFQKNVDLDKAIDNWRKAEYNNVKKQMTWFKKDKRIHWFNIQDKNFQSQIVDLVFEWNSQLFN